MKQEKLQEKLSRLINDFGYEDVRKTLGKMQRAKSAAPNRGVKICRADAKQPPAKSPRKGAKPNALRIVRSIDITDDEKQKLLLALAEKYEAKEFMPNVNHVRNFLWDGERDVSRIKSRQQVTSAVFKQLAGLENGQLREMLDRGLYGPPKRLEPFARAIEGFNRPERSA